MSSARECFSGWLKSLPEERRDALARLVDVIETHLPHGFEPSPGAEAPSWVVPKSIYPPGYHCDPKTPLPFLGLGSTKGHVALYHMGLYSDPELLAWFEAAYRQRVPTKLDMGKSCIRFKKVERIPFDLIGELCTRMTPHRWVEIYESARSRG